MKKILSILFIFVLCFSTSTVLAYKPGTLYVGSAGESVRSMQQQLAKLGFTIVADGKFGPKTKQIVGSFQLQNGLTADGVVGPKTLTLINNISSNNLVIDKPKTSNDLGKSCSDGKPSLQILSPSGGELFHEGDKIKVVWKSCNIPKDIHIIGNIINTQGGLELTPENLSHPRSEYLTYNDGVETFSISDQAYEVGSMTSGLYTVALSAFTSNDVLITRSESNKFSFDISNAPVSTTLSRSEWRTLCLDENPHFEITSPGLGSVVRPGEIISVDWNKCNIDNNKNVAIHIYSKSTGVFGFLTGDSGVPNSGMSTVVVPAELPTARDYQFIVGIPADGYTNSQFSVFDESDLFIIR